MVFQQPPLEEDSKNEGLIFQTIFFQADMFLFMCSVVIHLVLSEFKVLTKVSWVILHEISGNTDKNKSRTRSHPGFKVSVSLTWPVMVLNPLNQ